MEARPTSISAEECRFMEALARDHFHQTGMKLVLSRSMYNWLKEVGVSVEHVDDTNHLEEGATFG